MDCDVLIAGMGPVGLLLANLLGERGIAAIACDPAPATYDLPRAAVIDDEVLRIMQSVGLDAAVLGDAQAQPAVSYVTGAGRAVQVLTPVAGALGHPPLVSIHQPSMERTLAAGLARFPSVDARWGTRVEALDRHAEHVVATLRPAAGGEAATVRARWAVGCDGAASPTRGRLGIDFGGSTFAQRWLVVDATVDRPLARVPHPYFVGDRERPIVSLPMSPGRHRWEFMLHPGEPEEPMLDRAAIAARLEPWLTGERAELERAVIYTFHARTAARWRAGRILLAGDAAHVTPPFAGQGFSSGARDVANLAWKLDAVLRGAPERLLDTYEAERRPHVTAMQRLAVRWGGVVQTTAPRRARVRDRIMDALDGSAPLRWAQGNVKPLPTYGAGAFAERPARFPPRRAVGALFPQPVVGVADGPDGRLDDIAGAGWVALSRDPGATRALADAGVTTLQLGRDLHDAGGVLRAWLLRHHAAWVLLRPDRFVFACGPAAAVPTALAALRATVGETAAVARPAPSSKGG